MKYLVILAALAVSSVSSANLDRSRIELTCNPINSNPTAMRAEIGYDTNHKNVLVVVVSYAIYNVTSTVPTHFIKKSFRSRNTRVYMGDKFTLIVDLSRYNTQLNGYLGNLMFGKRETSQIVNCQYAR
ncbi:MAG: hypothetical protein SGI74_12425 [Oligoflexia bacterium]|nr:hypothetical protein [Oligoflexia bacterium]